MSAPLPFQHRSSAQFAQGAGRKVAHLHYRRQNALGSKTCWMGNMSQSVLIRWWCRAACIVVLSIVCCGLRCSAGQPVTSSHNVEDGDPGGWHFIRGPNFNGHVAEEDLADSWPESGPPVLWTRELGQGYSSFIAWRDRVATQTQTLRGQFVVCLDANSGETLWEYRYGWPYDPAGVYPGPRATPTCPRKQQPE